MLRRIEKIVRGRWSPSAGRRSCSRRCCPGPLRDDQPLDGIRRRCVPAPGSPDERPHLLGPTHEELFTLTVKGEYSSTRIFPLLFQIQTKYRDEARPRAGILRGREFIMKDSLPFDVDDNGLREVYMAHRDAYQTMFARMGIRWRDRLGGLGAMGGSASEEFLAESEVGEDTFVRCLEPGYAANVEAVTTRRPTRCRWTAWPSRWCTTPATPRPSPRWSIGPNATLGRTVTAADTLKNVCSRYGHPVVTGSCSASVCRGPRGRRQTPGRRTRPGRVRDARRRRLRPASLPGRRATSDRRHCWTTGSVSGRPAGVGRDAWITGADEPGRHVVGLVAGRDFTPDGTIEAAEVRDGDPAPDGAGRLVSARGIEIGHIFQLGRKYTDAFAVDVLGENGKPVRLTMGSYGSACRGW